VQVRRLHDGVSKATRALPALDPAALSSATVVTRGHAAGHAKPAPSACVTISPVRRLSLSA
jgi:hypothetical protein